MKHKPLLLMMLLIAIAFAAEANPVDMRTAREVAVKFVNANAKAPLRSTDDLQLVTSYSTERGAAAFHIFNIPNGFVIVAADDVAHPILAYSLDRSWPSDGNLPPQVTDYLDNLANQIEAASNQPQDRGIATEWSDLLNGNYQTRGNREQVGPLLTTTWNQGQYYNAMCPEDPNGPDGHAVTGCVATAMAQIINYWNYPQSGRGIHSYECDYGCLIVNYEDSYYDYNNMPNILTSESSEDEINAVAKLMYDCGVAVNMGYTASESSTSEESVRVALINHFGYSLTTSYAQRQMYLDEEWMDSLRANIDRSEPVLYCGRNIFAGHAFVLDGYNQDVYFHFNFGWSGDCDGWYLITAINAGWGFSDWSSAIMGILPDSNANAIICQIPLGLSVENYSITEPMDLYPMRGGSEYLSANELIGLRINLNLVPEDESGQLVLDVLEFDNEQSVVIYDGINKDSLVRVIETRNLDDWNTVTYHTWFYEGGLSDTVFQNMANTDFSPIVSTKHGFTVVVYSYGGFPEGFHLRVSDASDCRMVSNLTAVQDSDGILVSWTENGDASQWQVKVEETIHICDSTLIQLTGLSPNSSYNVQVRAVCGEENYSSWNTIIVNKKVYWTDVVKSEPEGYLLDGDTIRITTPEGLAWLTHCMDSLYLTGTDWEYYQYNHRVISIENDLDLSGYLWTPIRTWLGNLNGHGHAINNMNVSTQDYGGLFLLLSNVRMSNLGMINAKVNAISSAGPFAGSVQNCHITNCWSYLHTINSGNGLGGGLIGNAWNSQIENCYAYGDVYAQFGYGGLIGYSDNTDVSNCVTGLVESLFWEPLTGYNNALISAEVHGGSFSNCFADISVGKRTWSSDDPEYVAMAKRAFFLGHVYNVDAIDNLAAFNISIDPMGMLIADTAVNYTLGENMDVVTALNNKIAEYNSPDLRTWDRDEVTHMPVFGDYFEVTCPNVSNINAENIAYNDGFAVVLSWQENGDAEQWQIKCKIQNAPDNSAIILNTGSINDTIEGLQLGNMYEFYVRPICGDEPTVGWGQSIAFFVDKALWVDMVTECPEGYFEDSYGNVTISSPEGLAWLAKTGFNYRNNTIFIANDLDMGAYKWTPIGRFSFEGTIEGNNHVISCIYCNEDLTDNFSTGTGLIAYANNATFNNVVIQNSSFTGNRYVGSLVGYLENGTVDNCHAYNVIAKGVEEVGGLGGVFASCETHNCSSSGFVYADLDEGGLIGTHSGTIKNCYSNCYVRSMGNEIRMYYGGLFGTAVGIVDNCYSSGDVEAGTNDTWDRPGGRLVGHSLFTGNHLYARYNSELPFVERVEDGVLSDTASFVNNALQTPVVINNTSYSDLFLALNAWVDANNTEGQYLHWVADTAMVNGGFPMLEQLPATTTQTSSLTSGWNWWSTYIEQSGTDGMQQLQEALSESGIQIKSQTEATQNWSGTWFGQLTTIENEKSYLVNTSAAASVSLVGAPANPEDHPITLQPNWNWIGYPVGTTQSVEAAIGGFVPQNNDIIKGQGVSSTFYTGYGWFPSMNLVPGQGYLYKSNATENRALTFVQGRREELKTDEYQNHWSNDIHAFAGNMTVIAAVSEGGTELYGGDYELGAFVDGENRGSVKLEYFEPLDRYYAVLTVNAEEGERVTFGLVGRRVQKENFDSRNAVTFTGDAVIGTLDRPYLIEFGSKVEAATVNLYPNPVGRNEAITLDIPADVKVTEIVVTDMLGRKIRRQAEQTRILGGLSESGVYNIQAITEDGNVYHGRIIVK